MLRIPCSKLVHITADGNYANVVTQDNRSSLVPLQLGQIEDLIADQLGDDYAGKFLRLGRSLIINMDFVYSINVTKQRIILSDCNGCYHELSASKDVLTKVKSYIESTVKI